MELKLKVLQGTNAGQEVTINSPTFLIGRAEDCHLRPGSEMISRHHCVIVVDQTYVAIRDFGSKNGTYVNDLRVFGECELKSGDHLRVGPLEFEISTQQGELGGRKKPPVRSPKEAAERTAATQFDVPDPAQWLCDPADVNLADVSPADVEPGVRDTQCAPALETQSIRLTDAEQVALLRSPAVIRQPVAPHAPSQALVAAPATAKPAAASPVAAPLAAVTPAAVTPAAVTPPAATAPANAPKRPLPSTFQMPEPELEAPASMAGDKSGHLDKKKVFGKLPVQSKRPEDTRSAASDLLDKMRKRR
jgi:pSer/pThr/pTyr-binding forkhead associated (FHA) protein